MSKARPWACLATCFLTVISAIILLIAASVYTNGSYYLRHYWGLLYGWSIFTIIVAIFALITAIGLGYVSFRRFPALTTLFSGLLIFAALLSAICLIAFIVGRTHLREKSASRTIDLLQHYTVSDNVRSSQEITDRVQQTYQCCGIDQALNWATFLPNGKSTPDSCCRVVTRGCGNNSLVVQDRIYLRGCAEPMASHYRQRYNVLIGMHVNLILFTLVSATLGLIFEKYIREQYQLM